MRLREGAEPSPLRVLAHVLERTLRLLHPFMPFITEEVWQRLTAVLPKEGGLPESIMISEYPQGDSGREDAASQAEMEQLITLVRAVRNVRAQLRIDAGRRLDAVVDPRGQQRMVSEEALCVARSVFERTGPLVWKWRLFPRSL